ncbi:hypothetical protein FOL47_008416 [Perkinsus chesapeaki]|uniref:FAD-binding PCMH-type domain-containing protein n=1 Tax=Perkinsus chesapeaki TaxID=330153 RepID=A0A7J6LE16_PERCH|nr:hypothetical protein FOL47_008416 [Perkinsus chesapeaki]
MLSTLAFLLLATSLQYHAESYSQRSVTLIKVEPPKLTVFNSSQGILKHVETLKMQKAGWATRQLSMIFSEDGSEMVGGMPHKHYCWMANPFTIGGSKTLISTDWLPDPEDVSLRRIASSLRLMEKLIMNGDYYGGLMGEFYALHENSDVMKYSDGLQKGRGVYTGVHAMSLSRRCAFQRTILKLRTTPGSGDHGLLVILCQRPLMYPDIEGKRVNTFEFVTSPHQSDPYMWMCDVAQLKNGDIMLLHQRNPRDVNYKVAISYINIEAIREAIFKNGIVTPTVIFELVGKRYLGDLVEGLALHEDRNAIYVYVLGKNYEGRVPVDAYYSKFHWAPNTTLFTDTFYTPYSIAIRPGIHLAQTSTASLLDAGQRSALREFCRPQAGESSKIFLIVVLRLDRLLGEIEPSASYIEGLNLRLQQLDASLASGRRHELFGVTPVVTPATWLKDGCTSAIFILDVKATGCPFSNVGGTPLGGVLHHTDFPIAVGPEVQTTNIAPPYNTRFDQANGYVPAAMVHVRSADDIRIALEICYDEGAPVAMRSNGGHSYIGQSTVDDGIIISFTQLTSFGIAEDGDSYIAKMGSGLKELEVYSRLARHDPPLGFAGGSGSTVGIAGLISGGGHGLSSAKYGLSSDRVVAAEVVIYNRDEDKFELITATRYNEHSDLLFAIRGGMGGNYGALVSLSYEAFPVTNVVVISGKKFEVNPTVQAQRIKSFQEFMHSDAAGPEIFGIGKFLGGGGIQYSAQCICDAAGDCTSCHAKLDLLEAAVGLSSPLRVQQDFGKAMWYWADCTADSWMDFYPVKGLADCSEAELQEAMEKCWAFDREVYGGPYKAKSIYFPSDMRMEDLQSLADAAVDPVCQSPGDCVIMFDFYGHSMSEEPVECDQSKGKCTAFDHRTPGWHMQILAIWEEGDPTPTDKLKWLQESYESVLPGSLGTAYQNYIDSDLGEGRQWIAQYFPDGGTYPRLQEVKCKYNSIDMYNFDAIDLMTAPTTTTEPPTTTTEPPSTTTEAPITATEPPITTTDAPTSTTEAPTTTTDAGTCDEADRKSHRSVGEATRSALVTVIRHRPPPKQPVQPAMKKIFAVLVFEQVLTASTGQLLPIAGVPMSLAAVANYSVLNFLRFSF